ncbi:MAG: hypothetical protein H2057_00130 [Alphaproteobacteria bacterium]|nr:hypothetical protein [Alphaproteobacteria bacterium]
MSTFVKNMILSLTFFGVSQGYGKELSLSYVQEHIHEFLEGKTLFVAPLKANFKVCYRRIGYDHETPSNTTKVAVSHYPLSPTIYNHYNSYQMFSVQRAHEERVDLIGICPTNREDMVAH